MWLNRLLHDRRAVTTVEYGLIGALVFLAATSAITTLGHQIVALFTMLGNAFAAAVH